MTKIKRDLNNSDLIPYNDYLEGNTGDDNLSVKRLFFPDYVALFGRGGDDTLLGESDDDYLDGGHGRDSIRGDSGNDTILGGDDNDFLYGVSGQDIIYGEGQNDKIYGGRDGESDTLYGGAGNDSLYGESGQEYLHGGSGNDYIEGGSDNDVVIYDGKEEDYKIINNLNGTLTIIDINFDDGNHEGIDTLVNINQNQLQFSLDLGIDYVYHYQNGQNLDGYINSLNPHLKTFVITHGFNSEINDNFISLADTIANYYDESVNLITWDWSEEAEGLLFDYGLIAPKVTTQGDHLANVLQTLNINPGNTTLIGHSLGGHLVGNAGEKYDELTGQSIDMIIGLDPAGSDFNMDFDNQSSSLYQLNNRLDDSDANHVVVLHTSKLLGYEFSMGDADYYINWDTKNENLLNTGSLHGYANTLLRDLYGNEVFVQNDSNSLLGEYFDIQDVFNPNLTGDYYINT